MNRDDSPLLKQAILTWKAGYPISVDLAMALSVEGYDVDHLEALYRA